ncbi:MAG TPA: MFS transporter [Micromonosporaceae bacterium]
MKDVALSSPTRVGSVTRVVGTAVAVTIASVLPVFLVGGLAVQIRRELHFSPAGLGLAVAAYFGASALAAVPAGHAVERFGSARTSRIAVAISAATLLAIGLVAHSYLVLLALLAVGATTNALGQLAANLLLAHGVPVQRQGVIFGLKQSAVPLATLLSGAAVPALALTVGWRWAFILAAGCALGVVALIPRDAGDARSRRPAAQHRRSTAPLVVVAVAAALAAGGANALGAFVVDSSVHRGLPPSAAGLVLTFGSAVCVTARLLGGWIADRRRGDHLIMVTVLLGLGSVGLALLALPTTVALVVGVVLAFGLGWSWPGVMNFAIVQLNPEAPAAATSITQTGVYAGGFIGPLGFGALATQRGYPTAWTVAAASMLAAAGLMLVGRRMVSRSGRR